MLRSLGLSAQANSLALELGQGCGPTVGTATAPGPEGSAEWCAWHVSHAIEQRDPLRLAAAIGAARAVETLLPLALIGHKVRNGGRRGAARRTAEKVTRLELFALDSRMRRDAQLSERARANVIARAQGLTPEAVRAQLRRARGKKKWGKPSRRPTSSPEASG